jgi:hypothetical protein
MQPSLPLVGGGVPDAAMRLAFTCALAEVVHAKRLGVAPSAAGAGAGAAPLPDSATHYGHACAVLEHFGLLPGARIRLSIAAGRTTVTVLDAGGTARAGERGTDAPVGAAAYNTTDSSFASGCGAWEEQHLAVHAPIAAARDESRRQECAINHCHVGAQVEEDPSAAMERRTSVSVDQAESECGAAASDRGSVVFGDLSADEAELLLLELEGREGSVQDMGEAYGGEEACDEDMQEGEARGDVPAGARPQLSTPPDFYSPRAQSSRQSPVRGLDQAAPVSRAHAMNRQPLGQSGVQDERRARAGRGVGAGAAPSSVDRTWDTLRRLPAQAQGSARPNAGRRLREEDVGFDLKEEEDRTVRPKAARMWNGSAAVLGEAERAVAARVNAASASSMLHESRVQREGRARIASYLARHERGGRGARAVETAEDIIAKALTDQPPAKGKSGGKGKVVVEAAGAGGGAVAEGDDLEGADPPASTVPARSRPLRPVVAGWGGELTQSTPSPLPSLPTPPRAVAVSAARAVAAPQRPDLVAQRPDLVAQRPEPAQLHRPKPAAAPSAAAGISIAAWSTPAPAAPQRLPITHKLFIGKGSAAALGAPRSAATGALAQRPNSIANVSSTLPTPPTWGVRAGAWESAGKAGDALKKAHVTGGSLRSTPAAAFLGQDGLGKPAASLVSAGLSASLTPLAGATATARRGVQLTLGALGFQ